MGKKKITIRDWEAMVNTISLANQEEEYNKRMWDDVLHSMEAMEQEAAERVSIETQVSLTLYKRRFKY